MITYFIDPKEKKAVSIISNRGRKVIKYVAKELNLIQVKFNMFLDYRKSYGERSLVL